MSTDPKGHYPSALDRWLLVRYKKYATAQEVPNMVSSIMMRRIHEKARIHTAIVIMILSGVGMFTNAMIGKYQAKQGYSVEKAASEYQQEYNKRKEKELMAQMTK
ncbi:UPF0389 protein CG9231 [Dermatophagoides farinae]|uniref:Duf1075 domain containing protein n=1 Tax=Dermatophagoides farinae TaxID=6954 RepID=A0A922I5V7_DERFA|nr:uncharacterized protein LOC124490082 [Dermatophagoides farinae]KAH7639507.1 duf1075 domain containing protein [Dermatophagoides farinae]KAH9521833.1 hypothetical protein DERF_005459 [Dermatophagoides farinae]